MSEPILTHYIGWTPVRLFWTGRENNGGSITLCPDDGLPAKMEIAGQDVDHVMETLVHEVIEFAMTDLQLRFDRSPVMTFAHDTYLFVMTHPEFSEVASRVSRFLTKAIPVVMRLYSEGEAESQPLPNFENSGTCDTEETL